MIYAAITFLYFSCKAEGFGRSYLMELRETSSADIGREVVQRQHSIIGCLLGTAVGDALGLPVEALSRRRQQRLYPKIEGHRFLFGHGMISDDTEHSCMTAQALIVSAGDPAIFGRRFAWKLRWWLLSVPPAMGFATLRGLVKLWLGFSPTRSGVFSAGNGPAMRSGILGVVYGDDLSRLRGLVRASTRITHTDPKAEWSALAIAWAAHVACSAPRVDPYNFLLGLRAALGEDAEAAAELLSLLTNAAASAIRGESSETFANSMGLHTGVSGYCYHTVPVAIQAWLRRPDDFSTVMEVIRCGGDTDTVAAILGGLIGARTGRDGIPETWIDGLWEWPRSAHWIAKVGERLAEVRDTGAPRSAAALAAWALPLRSLAFAAIVLVHALRRMLPPY